MLLALKRQLAQASPATLARVQAEIAACVATASNVAQQAQAAASGGASATAELATASAAARAAVSSFVSDYYEKKIFDPYLTFASDEEERRFRDREAERLAGIRAAQAKSTPQGDLESVQLAIQQMDDAGAHGARRSPDFDARLDRLEERASNLEAAIEARSDTPEQPASRDLEMQGVTVTEVEGAGHGLGELRATAETSSRGPKLR